MFRKLLCSTGLLVGLLAAALLVASVHGLPRYLCNTHTKIEEIRQLNTSLRRLVEHNDRLYFIFRNRIISTDLMIGEQRPQYKFLSLDFKEQENSEQDVPMEIADNFQVYGYYQDLDQQTTGELYSWKKEVVQGTKVLHDKMSSISFENGELKRQPLNMQLPIQLERHLPAVWNPNATFFNGLRKTVQEAGKEVVFDLVLVHSFTTENNNTDYQLHFKFLSDRPTKPSKYQKAFTHFALNLMNVTNYDGGDGRLDGPPGTSHARLIGVLKEQAKLQFNVFVIRKETLQPSKNYENIVDPMELFNCFTPMTSLSTELKGIWYSTRQKMWYIIIRRFYLKVTNHVFEKGFELTPEIYMSKGRDLPLYRTTKFFDLTTLVGTSNKQVKNIGSKAYLSREAYKFHEIGLDAKNELVLTELQDEPIPTLNECSGSTLKIGEHLYCFKETFYNHMVNLSSGEMNFKSHPISSIFATLLDWTGQVVQLVFNYDDKHFVVMTQMDMFIFEYSRFTTKGMENDFRLTHSYNNTNEFKRVRNCLIAEECRGEDPRKPRTPEQNSWMRTLITRILIIVLVVGIVVIFALLVWTFRRGLSGEGSERAQYFVHLVNRMGSKIKSFSKLNIGSRMTPASQTGSLSEIPSEHRSPKKDEVMAKALKGLKGQKNVKDLKVTKSGKGAKKSPSESSLPGDKGKGAKKKKSLTGEKSTKTKSKDSLLGETTTKGSAISEGTKSKGSQMDSLIGHTMSRDSQLGEKKSKSGSKSDLKAGSKQPSSKSKPGSKSGS